MSNQYEITPRERQEAKEFWDTVKIEYNSGLNNYFGRREDKRLEQMFSRVYDKRSIDRRLKLGGE